MITNDKAAARRCGLCRLVKPFAEFHKHKSMPGGVHHRCKECVAQHRRANPTMYRKYKHDTHVRNTYGIQPADYAAMLAAAGGKCQICGVTDPGGGRRNLCVDHDHTTGEVRGLLCNRCNRAIGLLGDRVGTLQSAVSYLEGRR